MLDRGDQVAELASGRAADVVAALRARGQTIAVAESLTGGLLAAALVEVPGASDVFRGGLVVYATDLKATLAGVPEALLAERGPVDPDVAAALAAGARDRCGADWALSTTGVAGPEPHGGQPVGTVWLGVAGPDPAATRPDRAASVTAVRKVSISGDRAAVRDGAVRAALDLIAARLGQHQG